MTIHGRPTLTVGVANYGVGFANPDWTELLATCRAADEAGVDRLVVVDHVVMGPHTEAYSWGKFPVPPDAPWMEPLTCLAAIAAVTTRVRLATGILIAPLRPAAVLAKTAATLDVISAGRLDLGVGAGWQREEYDTVGLDFDERGQLLTDTLAACRVLWRDSPASFDSPTVRFDGIWCEPKPLQPGGVPLWVAGTLHRRNLDRLVRFGDGWIPIMGETVEGLAAGARTIAEAWKAAGRDGSGPQIRATLPVLRDGKTADLERSLAEVPALVAAGATDIHVNLRAFSPSTAGTSAFLTRLVSAFAGVAGG